MQRMFKFQNDTEEDDRCSVVKQSNTQVTNQFIIRNLNDTIHAGSRWTIA